MSDNFDSRTAEIPLTKGYVAIVDEVDSDLANFKWYASSTNGGYYAKRSIVIDSKHAGLYLHRAIMERILERPLVKSEIVDHINGNILDNRRVNLRLTTIPQNVRNQRPHKNNTSGFKGVSWDKNRGKWAAHIMVNHKSIGLGRFSNIRDAVIAYNEAAVKHFGEYARLNEVPPTDETSNPHNLI